MSDHNCDGSCNHEEAPLRFTDLRKNGKRSHPGTIHDYLEINESGTIMNPVHFSRLLECLYQDGVICEEDLEYILKVNDLQEHE